MEYQVGEIYEGTVKTITNFGAFVALPGGRTGLVHISEVAYAYVTDVRQHLTEGQTVKVAVLSVDPAGKINLSVKRALPKETPAESRAPRPPRPDRPRESFAPKQRADAGSVPAAAFSRAYTPAPSGDQSFENMLKQFKSESDSKLSSARQYADHKTRTRKR